MNDRQGNLLFDLARIGYEYLRPRKTCVRCGNRYRAWQDECPRCVGLDDDKLEELRQWIATEERPMQDLRFVAGVAIAVMTAATIFVYLATGGR